jgi:hypothetical protein
MLNKVAQVVWKVKPGYERSMAVVGMVEESLWLLGTILVEIVLP